jgi:site-specific DNA recombinase
MTAGHSKGKKKYYLYYRCIKCSGVNIPVDALHKKFEEILALLSLTRSRVDYLQKQVKVKIGEFLGTRKIQAKAKAEELTLLEKKIDDLEEKMVNNEIEVQTYKKWFKKFGIQKAKMEGEILELNTLAEEPLRKVERLIPALLDLPGIFKIATIFQKHTILKEVFKAGLTYVGMCLEHLFSILLSLIMS